jgi:hypothetical protein
MFRNKLLRSLLVLGFAGCGNSGPVEASIEDQDGFEGCKQASASSDRKLADDAEAYFLAEVGAEIESVRVSKIAYCEEATFVVLTARTRRAAFPAQWLVSIRRGPPDAWDLVRPE